MSTLRELLRQEELLPGTVLVLKSGTRLLVGDINSLGGVCDDCRHWEIDEEVVTIGRPRKPEESQ